MYICPNCNKEFENLSNFCSYCGTPLTAANELKEEIIEPVITDIPAQPVQPQQPVQPIQQQYYQQPYYQQQYAQPQYTQPVQYVQPVQQPKTNFSKPKSIVGMALSISGTVFAFIGFIYTIIFSEFSGDAAFFMSFFMSAFSLPLSIIGLKFSKENRSLGDTSALTKVGKIFGIIGIVFTSIVLFIGLMLLTDDTSSYDMLY